MKITVCIGSFCHVKGSHHVIEEFKRLIEEAHLGDKVEMGGQFCMGECGKGYADGVRVLIDDTKYLVKPDDAESFFKEHVLAAL